VGTAGLTLHGLPNPAQALLRGQRTEKKASSQLSFSPSAERDLILQSKEKEED